MNTDPNTTARYAPLDIAEKFRLAGYQLVNRIAGFLNSLAERW